MDEHRAKLRRLDRLAQYRIAAQPKVAKDLGGMVGSDHHGRHLRR